MKKLIILLLVLAFSATSFSQPTHTTSPVKTDYLKKSKKQKTVAWSLLLGGLGLETAAFATAYETELGANLLRVGFLATLTSIPFFIMAHGNKKKGMSLSFKNETGPLLQKNRSVYKPIPSLSLKINL